VTWLTEPPLRTGPQLTFVAHFLGRRLVYTYELVDLVPGERMTMRTADGPFPMETSYVWTPVGSDRTRMTLRNRGEPSGFAGMGSPLIVPAMRKANHEDLQVLKRLLESR
jgi:hypothetical protein